MRSRELDKMRTRLLAQRNELLKIYHEEIEESRSGTDTVEDPVDQATAAYQKDLTLALSSADYDHLAEIEDAIARLDSGAYGECESCAAKIPQARIEAVPWARLCVDCQEREENERG